MVYCPDQKSGPGNADTRRAGILALPFESQQREKQCATLDPPQVRHKSDSLQSFVSRGEQPIAAFDALFRPGVFSRPVLIGKKNCRMGKKNCTRLIHFGIQASVRLARLFT
jgi:hypothetical protein